MTVARLRLAVVVTGDTKAALRDRIQRFVDKFDRTTDVALCTDDELLKCSAETIAGAPLTVEAQAVFQVVPLHAHCALQHHVLIM